MNTFDIAFGKYDTDPNLYFLSEQSALEKAVFLALKLSKPLLITGEPGVGKTQLAYWAANALAKNNDEKILPFRNKPFVFITKSKSDSKDLFYNYDAISHFQDKEGKKDIGQFINLNAMGLAIAQSYGLNGLQSNENYKSLLKINNINQVDALAKSSVILIDEIDKAPRDFSNDLLDEIENSRFELKEMNAKVSKSDERKARLLTILTSNNESNLPEPFLRRCLFLNINFPSQKNLLTILNNRLTPYFIDISEQIDNESLTQKLIGTITAFNEIRNLTSVKKPSISELIDWIKVLHLEGLLFAIDENFNINKINNFSSDGKQNFKLSLLALLKNNEDVQLVEESLNLQ